MERVSAAESALCQVPLCLSSGRMQPISAAYLGKPSRSRHSIGIESICACAGICAKSVTAGTAPWTGMHVCFFFCFFGVLCSPLCRAYLD